MSALFLRNRHTVCHNGIRRAIGEKGWLTDIARSLGPLSMKEALEIQQGRFRVFSSIVQGGRGGLPDWHTDYLNNHRFFRGKSSSVKINDLSGADCLFPLELSRLQFLTPLVFGDDSKSADYRKTNFVNRILDDWQSKNKPGRGVNWRIHMECAMRALSLLPVLSLYSSDGIGSIAQLMASSILPVIRERILSRPAKRHNHYLIELICTYLVCDCFKDRIFQRAREIAIVEIRKEIDSQFLNGINFECSLAYHSFTVEALLLLYSFLQRYGETSDEIRLKTQLQDILPKSLGFIRSYMGTMGVSPQFGDSSDARMLFSGDYYSWNPLDHSYAISMGRCLGLQCNASQYYSESGYAFLKTSLFGISACAAKITKGYSGHSHMDKLSWTLAVRGTPVFVDPGTWMYNSDNDLRKYFRSTMSHNTPAIDGLEQADVDFNRAFTQFSGIDCRMTCCCDDGFQMTHNGYARFSDLGSVSRRIQISHNSIMVFDKLQGSGIHKVEIGYLIHPDASDVFLNGDKCEIRVQNCMVALSPPEGMSLSLGQRWYSPAYGVKVLATRVCFSAMISFPVELNHKITVVER